MLEFNYMLQELIIITSSVTWEGETVAYHMEVSWHSMLRPRIPVLVPDAQDVIFVIIEMSDWTAELFRVQYSSG